MNVAEKVTSEASSSAHKVRASVSDSRRASTTFTIGWGTARYQKEGSYFSNISRALLGLLLLLEDIFQFQHSKLCNVLCVRFSASFVQRSRWISLGIDGRSGSVDQRWQYERSRDETVSILDSQQVDGVCSEK